VAALHREADVDGRLVEVRAAGGLAPQLDRDLDRGSASSSPGCVSATWPTAVMRPRAVRPVGSSTLTRSPVRASRWRVAASFTVTRRSVEETSASSRPGAACCPIAALAWPIRVAPGRKTTLPRASVPSCASPRAAWKRRTAALVAQSHSSSTAICPAGSCPSARRLRSSWRTSRPSSIPAAKSRQPAAAVEQERRWLAVEPVQRAPAPDHRARRAQPRDGSRGGGHEAAPAGVAERPVELVAVDQVAPLDRGGRAHGGGSGGRGVAVAVERDEAGGGRDGDEHAADERRPPPHEPPPSLGREPAQAFSARLKSGSSGFKPPGPIRTVALPSCENFGRGSRSRARACSGRGRGPLPSSPGAAHRRAQAA
jgi:hypothetical protein